MVSKTGKLMLNNSNRDVASRPLRGRLAPSPTGALHLGNARSFLIAWLSIRARGGTVVLRMEDLDHPKVKPWASEQALNDLRWLGLDWDEGPDVGGPYSPYTQSQAIEHYAAACEKLQLRDLIYPCVCSRADVEAAQSAPHAGDDGPRYPGTCRDRFASFEEAASALSSGRLPAWRFRTPNRVVGFHDGFHGEVSASVAQRDGDFVIARHAQGAGYMLGVVVDDARMEITEVIRGDDLLPATHRQLLLYEALALQPPAFVHVPLVVGMDGRRLAKRHGDTRITSLRESGMHPAEVVGMLAYWSGWATEGERLMPVDLLGRFDMDKLPNDPVVLPPSMRAVH
jgi:glutamyl-tRNA synthetase